MLSKELDYELPEELIAQAPLSERDASRLLVLSRNKPELEHRHVRELAELLPKSLFVFNDTRVIPARLRGVKPTGGKVELLLVERVSAAGDEETWSAMARPLKSLRPGLVLAFGKIKATVIERRDESTLLVRLHAPGGVGQALESEGEVPLPPYIARKASESDKERYQTVFAREPGAVAAPTAGLHFSDALIERLLASGHTRAFVTLHVGPGTFMPLTADDLREHPMHEERYFVPEQTRLAIEDAKREGRLVVAVGTTVVRTLESAAAEGALRAGPGATRLCIYPPYDFRVIDAMVTNFHLPRSTLLALVMAFAGQRETRGAYEEAVREKYRFFSYGDAMLVRP